VLRGTLTKAALGGGALFADLWFDRIGTGYTLTATAPNLTSATSSAVDAGSSVRVWRVTPASGPISGGTWVEISGYRFVNVTAVTVDGVALRSLNVVSTYTIRGETPVGASVGAKDIVVVSSIYGTATCTGCFTYDP
jgi:hypothetical protein